MILLILLCQPVEAFFHPLGKRFGGAIFKGNRPAVHLALIGEDGELVMPQPFDIFFSRRMDGEFPFLHEFFHMGKASRWHAEGAPLMHRTLAHL